MNNINTWIAEKPYALVELYLPSAMERKIHTYAIDYFNKVGQKSNK
jgi:hypothetical protein